MEFRQTPRQLLLYPGAGILIAAGQLLSGNPELALLFGAVFAVITVLQTRWGVALTPAALVLRGITKREIPWADIDGIETGTVLATTVVRARLGDGSRKLLRAPLTGFLQPDPEFPAKVARIDGYWRGHRGSADG